MEKLFLKNILKNKEMKKYYSCSYSAFSVFKKKICHINLTTSKNVDKSLINQEDLMENETSFKGKYKLTLILNMKFEI
jgi:hypothetical protein